MSDTRRWLGYLIAGDTHRDGGMFVYDLVDAPVDTTNATVHYCWTPECGGTPVIELTHVDTEVIRGAGGSLNNVYVELTTALTDLPEGMYVITMSVTATLAGQPYKVTSLADIGIITAPCE